MSVKVRLSSRVAVIRALFLFLATNVGQGFSPANHEAGVGPTHVVGEFQVASASDLDRALRANDLDEARALVPVSWAASEQLFVSYLERAFVAPDVMPGDPDARTLASRLAEVFFRIVEYDFARAVVLALDAADRARRQHLVAAVRDYFVTLEGQLHHLIRGHISAAGSCGVAETSG